MHSAGMLDDDGALLLLAAVVDRAARDVRGELVTGDALTDKDRREAAEFLRWAREAFAPSPPEPWRRRVW